MAVMAAKHLRTSEALLDRIPPERGTVTWQCQVFYEEADGAFDHMLVNASARGLEPQDVP